MKFPARALHYVFRVANREASYKFYTEILGMKVLRHEEFEEVFYIKNVFIFYFKRGVRLIVMVRMTICGAKQ